MLFTLEIYQFNWSVHWIMFSLQRNCKKKKMKNETTKKKNKQTNEEKAEELIEM